MSSLSRVANGSGIWAPWSISLIELLVRSRCEIVARPNLSGV